MQGDTSAAMPGNSTVLSSLHSPEAHVLRSLIAVALAVVLASCSRNAAPTPPRGPSNVLTREEIATAHVDNAYDVVQRLRPQFLRARPSGMNSSAIPVVFVDGIRRGAPEMLRTLTSAIVEEIRFFSAAEATLRYGLDLEGGVIDVKLVQR
jgi:hypothetical protein